jgi:hypothetical protein
VRPQAAGRPGIAQALREVRRAAQAGRESCFGETKMPALGSRASHCKRGHEYTPANIKRRPNGIRCCRECSRVADRARHLTNPLYKIWIDMRSRCYDENHRNYGNYGGRGIQVEWADCKSFVADMGDRPRGMTIERIDNDGNYSKSNCRWASRKDQVRNRRNTVRVNFHGVTYLLCELAERFDIHHGVLRHRLKSGWPIDRALTERVAHAPHKKQAPVGKPG